MDIDRILARLKKHRRDVDKAITALEKLKSMRNGKRNKRRISKSKTPIPKAQCNGTRLLDRSRPQEHEGRIGIALVHQSKKVS